MADFVKVEVDSKSLEEKLKSLSSDLQTKIMQTALREGAKVYQAAVSEAAPEHTDIPTPHSTSLPPGALKSDVVIAKTPNTLEYSVVFGKYSKHVARWMDRGFRLVKAGYSRVTKRGNRGPGKEVKFVEPKSVGFFRNAFEQASSEAEKAITDSITLQVNKKWNS